ncbi:hypothetical protein [Salsuginibacillus kocurii]|uniref:hypothetical protein n=1 Tax=Salsuginibacillus kocurii TaxID=427078 RepID=UPI0003606E82|nr:hypothetical protein [Salsuginibacillus kocurii]
MTVLKEQPVVHPVQKIGWTTKYTEEEHDTMQLCKDGIYTSVSRYNIKDVLDMSYRHEPNQIGFLYLHTIKGVRTYYVRDNPQDFVETFREYRKKLDTD